MVVRVVGMGAPNSKEPWWLATSLDEPLAHIASLYDRRRTIEEQIRDSKGCRLGRKLEWTQFRTPDYLARFMLLLAVALAVWTAVGAATVPYDPSLQFCNRKGPRLSLVRVGVRWLDRFRNCAHLGVEFVRSYLLPPSLRTFDWRLPQQPQRRAA